MPRNDWDQSSVPVSFVDLFACGLGAVLLLWLSLVASTPEPADRPGKGPVLSIEVQLEENHIIMTRVPIGVVARIGNATYAPMLPDPGGRGVVFPGPATPAAVVRSLQFTTTEFSRDDELLVHLYDLMQSPHSRRILVTWRATGGGLKSPKQGEFTLTRQTPARVVALESLFDPAELDPEWKTSP